MLSRPRLPVSSRIAFDISSLLSGCSAESFCTRAAGRVSRPRLRMTSNPLLHSSILLNPTSSSSASRMWTDTVFGVSGCSCTGLCGFASTHSGCPRCMSVSWIFKGEEWPTSGRSPWTGAIVDGRSGLGLQRSLEPALFKTLGVSDALRESLKTTSGGRLASSAGV